MAKPTSANKRVVGMALFASSIIMVIVAILFGTGVLPIGDETRPILVGVLLVAAVIDAFMGWRFLMASSE
jgi:hypothetical protein